MLWIKSRKEENAERIIPLHHLAAAPRKYSCYSKALNMDLPCIEFQIIDGTVTEWSYSPEEIKYYFNLKERDNLVETLVKKRDEEYIKILALLNPQTF